MDHYTKFVRILTDQLASQIARMKPHEDAINRFGDAMAQFNLSISIYVYDTGYDIGYMSLTACGCYDHAKSMLALIQAGYEIGEPVEQSRASSSVSYRAPVSGHGFKFSLAFTTPIDSRVSPHHFPTSSKGPQ
jgi:hypothetical protein